MIYIPTEVMIHESNQKDLTDGLAKLHSIHTNFGSDFGDHNEIDLFGIQATSTKDHVVATR